MSTDNLWGDLDDLETIRTPKDLLTEQAQILTQATNGVLRVDIVENTSRTYFYHDFDIVVPGLNNYRYTLLKIRYPILFYPLFVTSDHLEGDRSESCADENAFRECLRKIFTSKEVRGILVRLISQVTR